jgi:CHAT domain-containing protein
VDVYNECRTIINKLNKNELKASIQFKPATYNNIKASVELNPSILHISSHGYYNSKKQCILAIEKSDNIRNIGYLEEINSYSLGKLFKIIGS